MSTVPI